ncbi:MAG: carbamoyl-phosphate synthase large subunit [Eubacteriales bacterium]|nr:carbamoyl-phosphate synthase large subunit [Eubacteriales bacterium]MDD3866958.1 carbamoyl-phosphate synthase large subunit [Eubacteriales bacterium]MDD4461971.1 carbamoyl-phosphate synthase large subunit [Eubacteriales bacterium]
MPRRQDIKKIMVIGSGPIIIGQAAEFDYAGTQACRALKAEGYEVVLINSNPATIMTDRDVADKIYLEPLQTDIIEKLLVSEKIDGLLATLGGQTGLNFAMELSESGFLDQHGIALLGTSAAGIRMGEDREEFRAAMSRIAEPCIPSGTASTLEECRRLAGQIGYPVIVRPAFTLGGTGGGIVDDEAELNEIATSGLAASRVHQVLIERSIAGWKEIEFEAVRDALGNAVTICSMENIDPVGIHTGDSIVVAPAQTLTRDEYQRLRSSALKIVEELEIAGGCNVQFAQHPLTDEYAVIEVNPRLSRSSALASKATGYPIAKVATRIAVGYSLDEIINEVTGTTYACYEPAVDYVVSKIPKWPFDKFVNARRTLGTQMKATGEVMAIAPTLEASLMKAIRSLELGILGLKVPLMQGLDDDQLWKRITRPDDLRLFALAEGLRRGFDLDQLHDKTAIDLFFLRKIQGLVATEEAVSRMSLDQDELLARAVHFGLTDTWMSRLSGLPVEAIRQRRLAIGLRHQYKMVDTCAGEYEAVTPYFYSSFGRENEAIPSERRKVLVIGSGPIRIGQGIEFDYCSVHSVRALRDMGYEAIIANNNPETVSTDFDTSDRLYFEPLTTDDVRAIIENEQPIGAICQFGGQTAIRLIKAISDMGLPILGTSADMVDAAEDRERFDAILEQCGIKRPQGTTVFTTDEALMAAASLNYPVLVRPSYVLGGQGMAIVYSDQEMIEYMRIINLVEQEHPILVDKYLMGVELEVDAVSDGEDILIPGIMEHLERAGVHSGDSISIFPAYIPDRIRDQIIDYTRRLAKAMKVIGLINIQFILYNEDLYVIEVNPRSSRTVPYISKVTGIPIVRLATRIMMGESLRDQEWGTGLYARYPAVYAIKAPVFSFEKLHEVDTSLGPEMKSTGEVLGLSTTYSEAMYKAILASGFHFPERGSGILLTVRDSDKPDLAPLALRLFEMGYELYGTGGTSNYLNKLGIPCSIARKVEEGKPDVLDMINQGHVRMLVNTESPNGHFSGFNGFRLRRRAIEQGIATITSLDTLVAVTECLEQGMSPDRLQPYEMSVFAEIVRETRHNRLPLNEMPMHNSMLKK